MQINRGSTDNDCSLFISSNIFHQSFFTHRDVELINTNNNKRLFWMNDSVTFFF